MASLKELQRALAARLTSSDASLDKERTPALLADFDADELDQSRETLIRKRLGQIATLMPRTRRALGVDYDRLCRLFIDQHHFQGIQALQLDAIHFARWLNVQKEIEPWKLDTAAWEGLRLQWMMCSGFVRIRRFRHLADDAADNGQPSLPQRSTWIAIRLGNWGLFRRL